MILFKNKIVSLFLAIFPLLSIYYVTESLNLYQLFVIILTPFFLTSEYIKKSKDVLILLFFVIFSSLVSLVLNYSEFWFSIPRFINNWFSIIIFFTAVSVLLSNARISVFIKVSFYIALISSIICIFQRLLFIYTGSFPIEVFFLKGFQLSRNLELMSQIRPSAFFTEPAHYCMYTLPVYYLTLLEKKFKCSIILLLGILCSGSTTGFIMLGLITLFWLRSYNLKLSNFFFYLVLFLLLATIIVIYFPEIIVDNIEKMNDKDSLSSKSRLFGTLLYIKDFNFYQFLFGITLNQLNDYLLLHRITLTGYFFDVNGNYANSFIYMFISYGLFGLGSLIFFMYKLYRNIEKGYGFLLILIAILLSDQILFNSHFVYLLSYVYLLMKKHT